MELKKVALPVAKPATAKKKGPAVAPPPLLTLPEIKSAISQNLGDYSILLYSEPKCGKTSLAAEFPEALFFMFDPKQNALSLFQVTIKVWADFVRYLDAVERSPRFKTFVVDTVDIAYQYCLRHVCDDNGWDHPSDGAYGKGWNAVNSEFAFQINRLMKSGRGVILTSHAAEKDIKTRLGEEYTKIVPTMQGGARAFCEGLVDIWIYMYHDKGGSRKMRLRADDHIAAGHRLKENFKGVEVVDAGKDAATAYSNLLAAFNNKMQTSVPGPKLQIVRRSNA